MRKLLLSLVLLLGALGVARPVAAQSADCFQGSTRVGTGFNSEGITVSNAALGFTTATLTPSDGRPKARMAVVTVAVDSIRFTVDGVVTPTAAIGHLVAPGQSITVCNSDVAKFRAIRVTTDASLYVTYFTTNQ